MLTLQYYAWVCSGYGGAIENHTHRAKTMAAKLIPSELAMRSSVQLGPRNYRLDYSTTSKTTFLPSDDATFKAAKGAARGDVLQMVRGTHFVLGDNQTAYTTTNKMRAQDGRRPGGAGTTYGDLLKSSLNLGNERVNYTSAVTDQYRPFGAKDVAVPSRDAAIKLMAGTQMILGDDALDYVSESKANHSAKSSMIAVVQTGDGGRPNVAGGDDPLSQNGRAQPLSSVLLGRNKDKWASTSIAVRDNPNNHKDFTPYKGRASAMTSAYACNIVMGDDTLDYLSVSAKGNREGLVKR